MDSEKATIADLLGFDDEAFAKSLTAPHADAADAQATPMAKAFALVPAPLRQYAASSIAETLKGALDIPLADVLATAWNTRQELRKYLDRATFPPEARIHHTLMRHTIKSTHRPKIEITVDGVPAGTAVEFEVELALALDGAMLDIRDGRIWAVHPGSCQGKGSIALEGATLLERKTGKIALPGTIRFADGLAIGEPYDSRNVKTAAQPHPAAES